VFDISVVQSLCRAIAEESDPDRTEELVEALREVIRDQQEEFRFRLLYFARRCSTNLADESEASLESRFDRLTQSENRRDSFAPDANHPPHVRTKSLFGRMCLTLLHEEFKLEEF